MWIVKFNFGVKRKMKGEKIEVSATLAAAAAAVAVKFKRRAGNDWGDSVAFFVQQGEENESPKAIAKALAVALKKAGVVGGTTRGYTSALSRYVEAGHPLLVDTKQNEVYGILKAAKIAEKAKKDGEAPSEPVPMSDRERDEAFILHGLTLLTDDQVSAIRLSIEAILPAVEVAPTATTEDAEEEEAEESIAA